MGRLSFWNGGKRLDDPAVPGASSTGREARTGSAAAAACQPDLSAAMSKDEAALLLKAYESSGQGWFWSTDASGNLTYLTDGIAPVLLGPEAAAGPVVFADLFRGASEETGVGRTLPFLMAKQAQIEKLVLQSAGGDEPRWWSICGVPQFDKAGGFVGYRGSGLDVTEQRLSSEKASRMSMYDALTGLGTRRRMTQVLDASLAKFEFHRRPCAVFLIDLDRFKQVNDTLGHPAGDALLKQVADRLVSTVGDRESIFRLGGDEFQIILRDNADREALGELAERVIAHLSQPYSVEGSRCIIGASIGVAVAPEDGLTGEALIRNADLALYAAKGAGRGCARFFSAELLESVEERRALEEDLRDALGRGEFRLYYQPLVSSAHNGTTGVEALIRWHHPERGSISPAVFIPIAEEINLIAQLGEWVLRKACEDAARWPGNIRVAVNVSPIQFSTGTLPMLVASALANSGLAANRLELEITEGVFLSDTAEADAVFASLKEIGVRLALDDFGTGYSSLGYLRTAPFDKIKIDQSFVRAATLPQSRNAAIIAAIVALAEALGMETTAEGIETEDQLDLIRQLRVSHVQGYIYSKPIPNDELVAKLENGEWVIQPTGPARQRSERISMYRKVGAILGNHYRSVLIRNLSDSGALIEGLDDVPVDSQLIIDFGQGRLAFARVRRSRNRQQGIQFEEPLMGDDAGGFRPGRRLSPYTLRAAGLPGPESGRGSAGGIEPDNSALIEAFRTKLGLAHAEAADGADANGADGGSAGASGGQAGSGPVSGTAAGEQVGQETGDGIGTGSGSGGIRKAGGGSATLTVRTLAERHLESIGGRKIRRDTDHSLITRHILPHFGERPVAELAPAAVASWLAAKADNEKLDHTTVDRLQLIMGQLYFQAIEWSGGQKDDRPRPIGARYSRRVAHERVLTPEEVDRLAAAVVSSVNQQLKYVVALLMLTGVRQRDLLEASWDDFDLEAGLWFIASAIEGRGRYFRLSPATVDLLRRLPRLEGCRYVLANPQTKRPYRSFSSSWETVRTRAGLPDVEMDDVRNCVDNDTVEKTALAMIAPPASRSAEAA